MTDRKQLIADGHVVRLAENGAWIFSIPMTQVATALADGVYRNGDELWQEYMMRTEIERDKEEQKRIAFARDIVDAYNVYISPLNNEETSR